MTSDFAPTIPPRHGVYYALLRERALGKHLRDADTGATVSPAELGIGVAGYVARVCDALDAGDCAVIEVNGRRVFAF